MSEFTLINKRVEYQTGYVDFGYGVVVEHGPEYDRVSVVDEDDGTRWVGSEDHITVLPPA